MFAVPVEGGNSEEGDVCVFPFTYDGVEYDECTIIGHNQLWCSISGDYEADGKWGNCLLEGKCNSTGIINIVFTELKFINKRFLKRAQS